MHSSREALYFNIHMARGCDTSDVSVKLDRANASKKLQPPGGLVFILPLLLLFRVFPFCASHVVKIFLAEFPHGFHSVQSFLLLFVDFVLFVKVFRIALRPEPRHDAHAEALETASAVV